MSVYKNEYTREISFPLGGIGTGCVGLSGTGSLIDWELRGKPNKCSVNEYSHFAIKAECDGETVDARVLQGDITKDFTGSPYASHHHSWGYGHGVNRTSLAGIAHFENVTFKGRFPIAEIDYKSKKMPADIKLTAFNPFIPSDEDNSSLPAAFFSFKVTNTSSRATDYTIAFSCGNPFKTSNGGYNSFEKSGDISSIVFSSHKYNSSSPEYGSIGISTDCDDVSFQEYWYRSGWFDDLTTFLREFSAPGKLKNRHYSDNENTYGRLDIGDMGTLCAHISLKPGEKKKVRFLLSWFFPFFTKYWNKTDKKPVWKNYYAAVFSDLKEVTDYCFKNYNLLFQKTLLFKNALYSSTLPGKAVDAVSSNLAVLKSTTCLRLQNGDFWAFEGTSATEGSCPGTCDHVWGYQYTLPHLFPKLERSVINNDFKYNMKPSGEMMFRTEIPLGSAQWDFRACVDGQMGCIIRLYRDWKICGCDEFLKGNYDFARSAVEYAWSEQNRDMWDPKKSGVITGRQHHTLDVELFGANSWLTGFYLAALKAMSEMADYLGKKDEADEYRRIFKKGQKYVENNLFNGSFYFQKINVHDASVLEKFKENDADIYKEYFNSEENEIKYQYGEGCEIDQLTAQWHASLCGLGDIFDKTRRATAAKSIYSLNFKSMRDVFNPCRVFAVNDEKGIIICEWADKSKKPAIPIPYTEECMTGFEYAAAGLMIQSGLVDEGIECINAVRDRYDGKKRNPYAEIECGSSYARSMSSFALLNIFSGFSYDMVKRSIGFCPVLKSKKFKCFWALDGVWGTVEILHDSVAVNVLYGELSLKSVSLPDNAKAVMSVTVDGNSADFGIFKNTVTFSNEVNIKSALVISYTEAAHCI